MRRVQCGILFRGGQSIFWLILILILARPTQAGFLSQERFFAVQVASVESVEEAASLVRRLQEQGLSAYRIPASIPGVGLRQRVRYGRYASAALARSAAEQALRAGWIAEYIVVREEPGSFPDRPPRVERGPSSPAPAPSPTADRHLPFPRHEILDGDWVPLPSTTLPNAGWRSLWFVDPLTGWVGGRDGALRRTTDGGQTWRPLSIGHLVEVTAIFFLSWNEGWLIGTEPGGRTILLATRNGGEDWERRDREDSFQLPWRSVCFLDQQTGLGIRGEGRPWRTKDGGKTWEEVVATPSAPAPAKMEGLQCRPRPVGESGARPLAWGIGPAGATAGDRLWVTQDGGALWRPVPLPPSPSPVRLRHLERSPTGPLQLQIGTSGSTDWQISLALSSTNGQASGGISWETVGPLPPGKPLATLFPDGSRGWHLTRSGDGVALLFRTDDRGQRWEPSLQIETPSRLLLWFSSSRQGWLISEEGALLIYQPPAVKTSQPRQPSTPPE
jgi:photosystem II stability/assembly factor-like uncharacterized protein